MLIRAGRLIGQGAEGLNILWPTPIESERSPEGALTVRLALYQPDIPQNLGAAIRLCACFSVPLDVIEPCGFALTDRALKRAALDYGEKAVISRHDSFTAFLIAQSTRPGRLIAIETGAKNSVFGFPFQTEDVLLLGRETAGMVPEVLASAHVHLAIPMAPGLRSLNVAMAGAIALSQALSVTGALESLPLPD